MDKQKGHRSSQHGRRRAQGRPARSGCRLVLESAKAWVVGIGLACFLLRAPVANATTYDWTVSSDDNGAAFVSAGRFVGSAGTVTSWTGTWDGVDISGLLGPTVFGGIDNLYPIDSRGVSFSLESGLRFGSSFVELYFNEVDGFRWYGNSWADMEGPEGSASPAAFDAVAETPIPEPGSLAVFGTAALLAVTARRPAPRNDAAPRERITEHGQPG